MLIGLIIGYYADSINEGRKLPDQRPRVFAIQHRKVYIQLTNDKLNPNISHLKDQLNLISRMLIWDDQKQSDLFDFACEVRMFQTIAQMFGRCRDKEIINHILGFFTTLLTNFSRQPSINYLLSHSSIAGLQLTKFGNMGHEVADYYINFIKVLARKVSMANLYLFFNKRFSNFPLLTQTIRFYNHPENLVRTTARNVVLSLAKLREKRLDAFMAGFPFVTYFIHECNFIKEHWTIIENVLHSQGDNRYQLDNLDGLVQDQEEVLIFLDDLLGLNQEGLADRFMDAFINECISPLAIALDSQHHQCFSIKVVLFVLIGLFKTFTSQAVINSLALIVFGKYSTKQLTERLLQPVQRLLSYDKKWKFKGFWDSHQDKIIQYCSQKYHQQSSINPQAQNLNRSIHKTVDTFSVFGVTNNFYQRQIQKVQKIFGLPIISSPKQTRPSASTLVRQLQSVIKSENGLNLEICQINPLSQAISSYLNSKDDSLVLLTITLINTFYNASVAPQILFFCKMSLKPKMHDFQSMVKIQKMVIACIKLFQVDPPCYRICTYYEAQQLAKKLLILYKPNELPLSIDIIRQLKNSLKVATDRVSPYLFGKFWQQSLQIYHLIKSNQKPKKSLLTLKHFGMIPFEGQSNQLEHQQLHKIVFEYFPQQFDQQVARDFWIYILIRDLFQELNSIFKFVELEVLENRKLGNKYQQGKVYYSIQEETIPADYQGLGTSKFQPCQILLMEGYFAIICNQRVELKASYEDAIVFVDKADSRKLNVKMNSYSFTIGMVDTQTTLQLRKHFQESKSVLLRYRLSQMVKETQQFLKICQN